MRQLIRLSLQGRRSQVFALAITLVFSALLVGTFGLLIETGVRGRVSTGEYAAAEALLGARQTRPVEGDVDLSVPERALMPSTVVDEIRRALPGSDVVADVIVPAVVKVGPDQARGVEAHPWSATKLGERRLASGRAPQAGTEVVVTRALASDRHLATGDIIDIGFGGRSKSQTVVGVLEDGGSGGDVPDVYLSDDHDRLTSTSRVAAVGVWFDPTVPQDQSSDRNILASIADQHDLRLWPFDERGEIEVVSQGRAKGAIVSGAAAFAVLATIVSAFTLSAITSLQVRERARELAVLRVVGATPRDVKRLVCGEIRAVAIISAAVGAIAGPCLGSGLVGLLRIFGAIPSSLTPVTGPLPSLAALAVTVLAAEAAARTSVRRVLRGSPLPGLAGAEPVDPGPARAGRVLLAIVGVGVGVLMACAPLYASGETAVGLPALSGLVIALSLGPLCPLAVRLVARTQLKTAERSATRYLGLSSLHARASRVGAALAPIVLGLALSSTQLFSGSTTEGIAADQVMAGHRADLMITASTTGVNHETADEIGALDGVAAVQPVVTCHVLVRGAQPDASWQSLPALAVGGDQMEQYADLHPADGRALHLGRGSVALSKQLGETLGVEVGDRFDLVLPDGRAIQRRVTGFYLRGLGFGEVVVSITDLQPAMPSGQPTALAVTGIDGDSITKVQRHIENRLDDHPGLGITAPIAGGPPANSGVDTFLPILLLVMLWGYIAITVVNALVITTLARREEFALLRVVGTTPRQQRRAGRWEAAFLAAVAILLATAAIMPGLLGLAHALSNGERLLPRISIPAAAGVIITCGALVFVSIEIPTRRALRR